MTESRSFSSADQVNPPASGAEPTSVNSQNDRSTSGNGAVNPSARGVNPQPDRDTVVRFLKSVYPHIPADRDDTGLIGLTAFTVTKRSDNRTVGRLGTWPERNVTHDHEWLADKVMGLARGVRPTGEESADHHPLVPVTGVFLRLPTLMGDWPTGNERGGQSNVRTLVGFVLDGDYDVAGHHERPKGDNKYPHPASEQVVRDIWREAIGAEPTLVWNSGGGVNGAWLLDEPVQLTDDEDGARLLKEWRETSQRFHDRVVRAANARGLHHDSVPNNDRLMRIAGTVNAKTGVERKLSVIVSDDGPRLSLDKLFALAPAPEETEDGTLVDTLSGEIIRGPRPAPRVRRFGGAKSGSYDGTETVWDHYDREAWESGTFRDTLRADGWQEIGFYGGTLRLTRPGKEGSRETSATLGANDGTGALSVGAKFFNFSDNAPRGLDQGRGFRSFLSPYWYLVHTQFGGDASACAKDLYARGYGARWVPEETPDDPFAYDLWATEEVEEDGSVVSEPDGAAEAAGGPDPQAAPKKFPGLLPEEFWERREVLQHIRQAAHARCAGGDATLYSVLTRLSGMVDHRIVADVGQGYVPLNLFAGVVGSSAANKTSSNRVGREMLMAPERDFLGDLPIGSGEGICEQFMGDKETGEFHEKGSKKGEPKTERGQVLHNIHFYVDEGETLIRLGRRENATLWPTLRSAWAGDTLGQTNASADRKRKIEPGSYAFGMYVGFQPSNAEPVLRDSETGTAQRFVWVQAIDPTIPMSPVKHPGPLLVSPQMRDVVPSDGDRLVIEFPEHVRIKLWTERVLRGRGELEIDELDKHSGLVRIKLAALMAMLDGGRWEVTDEDWELAEMMWAASCELRSGLLEAADAAAAVEAKARRATTVETATAVHEAKANASDARVRVARWISQKVKEGVPRNELLRKSTSRNRAYMVPGLNHAFAMGWITEDDEGNLSPGASQPA